MATAVPANTSGPAAEKENTALARLADVVDRWTAWFPFGKAPLILLIIACITGLYQLANPVSRARPTLRVWTFANAHYLAYCDLIPSYEAAREKAGFDTTVGVQLVTQSAITYRLRAAFWTDLEVPDLAEVEISRAGSFFQGPHEGIGFVDLTPFLERRTPDGERWIDKIVASRLAPYTAIKDGRTRIYGMPHDVHPVMLAYRADILEPELKKRGMTIDDLDTWDAFIALGRELTRPGERYMCEMSASGLMGFEPLFFQAGCGLFDRQGRVTIDDDAAVRFMMKYISMVVGPDRIAADLGWGGWAKAVEDGAYISYVCPDWRSKFAENRIPAVAGKMKLMPLPAWEPGGRRTSTWGGTMVGITRRCAREGRAEQAWELAKHLYFDTKFLRSRFQNSNILPPMKDQWKHPVFEEERAFYCGQRIGRMYIDLADQVPPQYASPFVELAKSQLGGAVSRCAIWYEANHEKGPGEFEAFVRRALGDAAATVRRQAKRNPF
jgi:arabinosaccharide transport system substrate-binding protein